jgi:hypothetical protein
MDLSKKVMLLIGLEQKESSLSQSRGDQMTSVTMSLYCNNHKATAIIIFIGIQNRWDAHLTACRSFNAL